MSIFRSSAFNALREGLLSQLDHYESEVFVDASSNRCSDVCTCCASTILEVASLKAEIAALKSRLTGTAANAEPTSHEEPVCQPTSSSVKVDTSSSTASSGRKFTLVDSSEGRMLKWLHPPTLAFVARKPMQGASDEPLRILQQIVEPCLSRLGVAVTESPKEQSSADFAVTLGGDGTVLWMAAADPTRTVPVVSFSLGTLGFMTGFQPSRAWNVLTDFVLHGGPVSVRQRVHCFFPSVQDNAAEVHQFHALGAGATAAGPCGLPPWMAEISHAAPFCSDRSMDRDESYASHTSSMPLDTAREMDNHPLVALNEIVLFRDSHHALCDIDVSVNGIALTKIQGDGLVVATPTGSTAYSLSAGGSVVHPSVRGICFTPICSHSLNARPLILADVCSIQLSVNPSARCGVLLHVDGAHRATMGPGSSMIVELAPAPVLLLQRQDETTDWQHALKKHLLWNERPGSTPKAGWSTLAQTHPISSINAASSLCIPTSNSETRLLVDNSPGGPSASSRGEELHVVTSSPS